MRSFQLSALVFLSATAVACASGGGGTDDGNAPDAAPTADGATATAVVSLEPASVKLARGETVHLEVTLDAEAARNLALPLEVVGGAGIVTVPAAVSIPRGEIRGSFDLVGAGVGGPATIRVGLGDSTVETQVNVLPRIASLVPAAPVQTYGQSQLFTITLDEAAPTAVELTISADPVGALTLPSVVTIPADATTQTFSVVGSSLGGPIAVRAAIGEHVAEAKVRVIGLWISEVMYNPSNEDTQKEWVELYNSGTVSVDLTDMQVVAWLEPKNGNLGGWQPVATLTGSIGADGCGAVGGPLRGPDNGTSANFPYVRGVDFNPNLGNAALHPASAVGLRTKDGLFIDAVIYGASNADLIPDESGEAPANADVVNIPIAGQSIERTTVAGNWTVQSLPSPGDCTLLQ